MLKIWLLLVATLANGVAWANENATTYPYFNCKDRSIKVDGYKAGSIEIELDGKKHVIPEAYSASGAKYETPADSKPHIMFWQKGNLAIFALDGKQDNACYQVLGSKISEDKFYHAHGIEPTWELILYPNKILFSESDDSTYLARPFAEQIGNNTTVFTLDQDEVANYIKIIKTDTSAPCIDTTTGFRYPDQVSIKINEQEYRGCGAPALTNNHFKPIIQNTTWIAKSLNNKSLEDHATISLSFSKDNKIHGSSGCNNYSGSYALEDDYIKINPGIVVTKKACASQEVMKNESAFLAVLPKMILLSFTNTGELTMNDATNETIITLISE